MVKLLLLTLLFSSNVLAKKKKKKRHHRKHHRRHHVHRKHHRADKPSNNNPVNPVRNIEPTRNIVKLPGIYLRNDLTRYMSRPYKVIPTKYIFEIRCPYSYCLKEDIEYITSFRITW